MMVESCEVYVKSKILKGLKLSNQYTFYKFVDSKGNTNTIPLNFLDYMVSLCRQIPHYYCEVCPIHFDGYTKKGYEQLVVLLTFFNQSQPLGFIWSVSQNTGISVPFVYPKDYHANLMRPRATSILLTSAMLVDVEMRSHYLLFDPTIVLFPE